MRKHTIASLLLLVAAASVNLSFPQTAQAEHGWHGGGWGHGGGWEHGGGWDRGMHRGWYKHDDSWRYPRYYGGYHYRYYNPWGNRAYYYPYEY